MKRRALLTALTALAAGCNTTDPTTNTPTPTTRTTTATTTPTDTPTRTTRTTRTTTEKTTEQTTTETTERTTTERTPSPEDLARDDLADADDHFGRAVDTYAGFAGTANVTLTTTTIATDDIEPRDVITHASNAGQALDDAATHDTDAHDQEIAARRRLNQWVIACVQAQAALADEYDRFGGLRDYAYRGQRDGADVERQALRDAASDATLYRDTMHDAGDTEDARYTDHVTAELYAAKTMQVHDEVDGAWRYCDASETAAFGVTQFEDGATDYMQKNGAGGNSSFASAATHCGDAADEFDAVPDADAVTAVAAPTADVFGALSEAAALFRESAVQYIDGNNATGRARYDDAVSVLEDGASEVLLKNGAIEELSRHDPPTA